MGANVSCPQDFEQGIAFSCRMKCPSGFKYTQEGGGSTPVIEKCVFTSNNSYFIKLNQIRTDKQFQTERERVSQEIKTLTQRIQQEGPIQDKITTFRDQRAKDVNEYNRIQSEYANYSSAVDVGNKIKSVTDSLKPMRPPLAGTEISMERKRILETSQPNMLVIQIALAIAVLSLLVYLVVPLQYAHILVFLLLSVGVAVGIFLKK